MADYDIGRGAPTWRTRIIMPRSRRARWLLMAFVLLLAAGCWPVIVLFNRPAVVAGLPLMALWSYIIVFSSVALMALGNRLPRDNSRSDDEYRQAAGESRES